MYLLYSLLYSLGLLVTTPYYLWRQRGRIGSHALRERLGFLPANLHQNSTSAIWIHAVSVGEAMAVTRLVHEIAQRYPERNVYLSHVTPAGREAGEKRFPEVAGRFYLPLDWAWTVRRALQAIRPALLMVVETELWPNLLRCAKESGARVVLINARLSDRSFGRYRALRSPLRRVFEAVDCVCAQTARDAERFEQIGARSERVVVTGNLKFDAAPSGEGEFARVLRSALSASGRGPALIAASTMPQEEPLIFEAWHAIHTRFPRALLVVAPRHPARFEEVASLLNAARISFIRRSAWPATEKEMADRLESSEALLLDTIGELAGLFGIADVVFMGGSLVPTGGHNLLEPAFLGKAIVFGPHMHNFRDIAELFLREDAAVQVSSAKDLGDTVAALFADDKGRCALGERARQVPAEQAGSTERTLDQIRPWLEAKVPARAKG